MKRQSGRLYNVLFPIWMLVWFPSWLWLILIPANLLIDGLVLHFAQKKLQIVDPQLIRKNLWKVCLAGFASDFAGTLILFAAALSIRDPQLSSALTWNPFTDIRALLIHIACIAAAGALIFLLNQLIFRNRLSREQCRFIALRMAVFTAPYLYLVPASLIYSNSI